MIVDTSVWVDYLRDVRDARTDLVYELLFQKDLLYITPTILQEVLQGIHVDNQFDRVKRSLLANPVLQLNSIEAAIESAQLYRFLRKKGVTIRKPNDCLIAHYAISYDMPMLHNDDDFNQIARFTNLRIVQV